MKLSTTVDDEIAFSGDTVRFCHTNTSLTIELICVAQSVTELVWSRNNETIHRFHVQSRLRIPIINGPYTVYLDNNTRVDNNRFIIVTSRLWGTVMISKDHHTAADQIECQGFNGANQVDNDSIIISYYLIGKLYVINESDHHISMQIFLHNHRNTMFL